ncbi:MAG TPA: hypothetical protein VNH11_27600 [Pirellulales bacterium]|nr:hypothetical protein [Pirellulales bacterium]
MDVALFNPDGLPVVDPLEHDAQQILRDARLWPDAAGRETLAGRLFIHFWRACHGEPGIVSTSLSCLGTEFSGPGNSASNIRKALRRLEKAGLAALPAGRLSGEFKVGMRRGAPSDAQQTLFELKRDHERRCFDVVSDAHQECAPAVRTDGAHRECAPPVRTASAQPRGPCEEKVPPAEDAEAKALAARIEARRRATSQPTARKLLERSYVPNVPGSKISSNVPNVPERSGNVEGNSGQGNVDATADGVEFLRQRDRIEGKYGRKDDCPWLPDSFALLAVRGPLSRAQFESVLESTARWATLCGAIKKQLATCGEARLREHGLWSEQKSAVQFYRIPRIKELERSLGVVPDEGRFPKPDRPKR